MISRVPRGLRFMAAGAFFFSVMSALVKYVSLRLPVMEIVLARSVVVGALALAVLLGQRVPLKDMLGLDRRILVLRGVLGFTALSCFYGALRRLPLADATVLHFTNPAFTAFIAAWALGEHLRWREATPIFTSLAGVILVARPAWVFGEGAALDPVGVALGLTAAVFSAGAYTAVRRLKREHPMVVVLYFASVSTVLSLAPVVRDPVVPDLGTVGLLAAVGVTTYLGQMFLTWGLQLEPAGRAIQIGYLQIVFAAVWGRLLFSDVPDVWAALGASIVVGSTLALIRVRSLS